MGLSSHHCAAEPGGRPSRQGRGQLDASIEYRFLLLRRHRDRILMAITMNADLVTGGGDSLHLSRKCFDRVPRNEPGGFDFLSFEQIEQTHRADFTREQTAGYVVGRVPSAI